MRHRQSSGRPLWPFIAVALLLHLNAGGVGWMYWRNYSEPRLDEVGLGEDRQDVGLIDGEDARRLVEEMQEEAKKKADEEAKKEEEDPHAKGQIVEVARPIEERRPDASKYLSQYDTTTVKETKARVRGPAVKPGVAVAKAPPPAAQPTPPMPQPSGGPPTPATPSGKPGTPGKASLLAMRTPATPAQDGDRAAGADVVEKTTPEGNGGQPARPKGGSRRPLAMGDLLPSAQQARQAGGAMNDYLKDAEEGEETALNARRWKFASFFNRLQRSVSQNWHPDVEYKRRDPSGNVYGYRDRLTIVRVKLKPDGSLANLALEHPCGVDFLDDEALEALKRAQPFPNPPRQLVDDSTGLISFRFGFMFELSTGSSFRVFRYQN